MSSTNQKVSKAPKLAYLLLLAAALVLAVTGLSALFFSKSPMTGWKLMLHVGSAPAFAIGLALVSLTWTRLATPLFWLVLVSGLAVILSGVVPMTPLFGTDGQHALFWTHCYSAVVLTASVVLHLVSRAAKRRSEAAESVLEPE